MEKSSTGRRGRPAMRAFLLGSAATLLAGGAAAQTAGEDAGSRVSEIVVTGTAATQRTSIESKRAATTIVDTVSAGEIGVLPDNSIAETLQRVVGVSGDRFKGSASELSIRGLGPFLGFATINGREISTGGGNRSVSFQQFPSELTKGVEVYKAQQADMVEGGVAGTVNLLTGSPLDYKSRRFDLNVKGQYDPYAAKFNNESGFGYRGSGSYIDQFDTPFGEVGVMLGGFRADTRVPEDFYTTSSSWRPCNTLAVNPATSTASCSIAQKPSSTATLASQPYYVSNSYNYRELSTEEKRASVMGSVEWRPSQDLRFLADYEGSTRDDLEGWHDLVLLDGRRGIGSAVISPDGVLQSYKGNSRLGAQTRLRDRFERYTGGGLVGEWTPGEWTIRGDLSDSYSHRTQVDRSAALGTTAFIPYSVQAAGFDIPQLYVQNFDPSNFAAFNSTTSANYSSNATDFKDEIKAARLDVTRAFHQSFLTSLKAGVRISEHDHDSHSASTPSTPITSLAAINGAIATCHVNFEESDWGEDSKGGGVPNTWATFDPLCLYSAFSGGPASSAVVAKDPSNADVTEKSVAGYVMASFAYDDGPVPFTGNIGVRVIRTHEDVRGYGAPLHAIHQPDGFITLTADVNNLQPVSASNSFTEVLPSLNIAFEPRQDFKIRAAVYKAIARPNMEEMSAGRTFTVLSGEATSVPAALASASGGNPRLEPLTSWNYDLSFEWYPDPLTIVAVAPYYKVLKAAFVTSAFNSTPETVVVDGTPFTVNIAQLSNSGNSSWLKGVEITAQHAFRNLPAPFNGLGTQLSYSYADSNYKFPDPSSVDPNNRLANFTDPAGIIGLSKHVATATVYWSNDKLEARLSYRYRSGYFKPLEPTGAAANRYVDSGGFLDGSIRYSVTEHLEIQLQGSNLTNEPQVMFRPVVGSVAQTEYSGPTYLLGVRLRY